MDSKKRNILIIILIAAFIAGVNQGIMNIALPHVSNAYHVPLSWANWLTVGFTIVAGTTITMAAALQSRWGLKKLLVVAFGSLILGSLISALAFDFWMLIAGRLIQAIATGIMFPTVTAVILKIIEPAKHGTWLATSSGVIACGMALGPLLSGWLLTAFGLQSVFIIMAIIAAVILVLSAIFLHSIEERANRKIDALSVLMSFLGLGAIMVGLGEVFRYPLESAVVMVVGAVIIVGFVIRQNHLEQPLLNLAPLKHIRFTLGEILVMFAMVAEILLAVLLPLYFEGAFGVTAFIAGAIMVGPVLVDAIVAQFAGRIDDHFGVWPLVPAGFLLMLMGVAGVLVSGVMALAVAITAALSTLTYAGVGCIVAPCKEKAIGYLPTEMVPHGSSINSVLVQVANSMGSAIFVGILSADVVKYTAAGIAKSAAYSLGFTHTITIAVIASSVGLILATIYCLRLRKKRHSEATGSAEVTKTVEVAKTAGSNSSEIVENAKTERVESPKTGKSTKLADVKGDS